MPINFYSQWGEVTENLLHRNQLDSKIQLERIRLGLLKPHNTPTYPRDNLRVVLFMAHLHHHLTWLNAEKKKCLVHEKNRRLIELNAQPIVIAAFSIDCFVISCDNHFGRWTKYSFWHPWMTIGLTQTLFFSRHAKIKSYRNSSPCPDSINITS